MSKNRTVVVLVGGRRVELGSSNLAPGFATQARNADGIAMSKSIGAIRLWVDPFARPGDPASRVRAERVLALLSAFDARGEAVALCLSPVRFDAACDAEMDLAECQTVELRDASGQLRPLRVRATAAECARLLAAAATAAPSTAPLLVFAAHADEALRAALEYPDASMVLAVAEHTTETLVRAVLNHRVDAATEPGAIAGSELARWLEASAPEPDARTIAYVPASREPQVVGRELDELLTAIDCVPAAADFRVCVVGAPAALRAAAPQQPRVEWCARNSAECGPERLAHIVGWWLPWSDADADDGVVARALASGRPVAAAVQPATAHWAAEPGVCAQIAGRMHGDRFVAAPRSAARALARLVAEPDRAEIQRARVRAVELFAGPRLAVPPAERVGTGLPGAGPPGTGLAVASRPTVVLEAPLFETSSSAHLTLATARALIARDRVDVLLVPRKPIQAPFAAFAAQAPDLVSRISRRPPRADLWVRAGWPVVAERPDARSFALRVDWEYGAIPTAWAPAVTGGCADRVIVHSDAVRRAVMSAGVPPDRISRIAHGVDTATFRPGASNARVLEFKRDRRAILFVGGAIWRKGVDVLVKAVLEEFRADDPVCLVVKPIGSASSYRGFHLLELIERLREEPRAIDTLILDEELTAEEMAGVYGSCDVLFHPYRGEGFGLPVLEARACGLPVVVTGGGSTDDFCADGRGVVSIDATVRFVELPEPCEGRPWVLEPDAASARAGLRAALEGRFDAAPDPDHVAATWTWDRSAAEIEALAFRAFGTAEPESAHGLGVAPNSRSQGASTNCR